MKPFGVFQTPGSKELSEEDMGAVTKFVSRADNVREQGGLEAIRMVRSLPGGGVALILIHGDVRRVIVRHPDDVLKTEGESDFEASVSTSVPMLFSGRVTKARVPFGEKVQIRLTDITRRRLVSFDPVKGKGPGTVELHKLTVPVPNRFDEFSSDLDPWFRSQYLGVRPTWYSGAMAQLMQVLGGYGRQLNADEIPKGQDSSWELAQVVLPHGVLAKGRVELQKRGLLPGYRGTPPKNGQLQYDYKYNQCHAVAFGSDRKPWLLQIDRSGVKAMPLPMIPMTTTEAYREWVEEVGDSEVSWVLDRFGGLPSGEPFPTGKELEAWRKAGVVLDVCDTADFYDHIAYSSAAGWAFNLSGTEGYNTCYDYDDGEGLAYGLMYSMRINIGPMAESRRRENELLEAGEQNLVNEYLASIYHPAQGDLENGSAVRFKLSKFPLTQLLKFATEGGKGYDYWLNYEAEPLALADGKVALTNKGWLNHGTNSEYGPQLKLPEPLLGYCVSFDFRPLINGVGKSPKCDTPMWAYYIEDDLVVASYFNDSRRAEKRVIDDFTDCMIVGSWERVEEHNPAGVQGNFYSSDVDERVERSERVTTTKIKGEDKGYDHTPFFGFDAPFWKPGSMWRFRYFTHLTNVETEGGRTKDIGLCVPYFTRSALLTAARGSSVTESSLETLELGSVQDPHTYRYWTYDFVFHWAGRLEVMRGSPFPKNGSPVWVEFERVSQGRCSDWADEGSWVEGFPQDYTWLVHPEQNVWYMSGGGGPPSVKEYAVRSPSTVNHEGHIMFSMLIPPTRLNIMPHDHYFRDSPDKMGATFYRDACQITAGERLYHNVSEPPTGPRTKWGYTSLADHESAHIFIGVINE